MIETIIGVGLAIIALWFVGILVQEAVRDREFRRKSRKKRAAEPTRYAPPREPD